MDIGLTMSTHGLLLRDERDFFLQRLEAAEVQPVELAVHAERLGYHSVWFSDHVLFAAHGYSHVTIHFECRSGRIEELFEISQRFAEEVLPQASGMTARPLV